MLDRRREREKQNLLCLKDGTFEKQVFLCIVFGLQIVIPLLSLHHLVTHVSDLMVLFKRSGVHALPIFTNNTLAY